jgi:hypothetical protein
MSKCPLCQEEDSFPHSSESSKSRTQNAQQKAPTTYRVCTSTTSYLNQLLERWLNVRNLNQTHQQHQPANC